MLVLSMLGLGICLIVVIYDYLMIFWIFGLLIQIMCNGMVFEVYNYNVDGQCIWMNSFGVCMADYSYNVDGIYVWVEDVLN